MPLRASTSVGGGADGARGAARRRRDGLAGRQRVWHREKWLDAQGLAWLGTLLQLVDQVQKLLMVGFGLLDDADLLSGLGHLLVLYPRAHLSVASRLRHSLLDLARQHVQLLGQVVLGRTRCRRQGTMRHLMLRELLAERGYLEACRLELRSRRLQLPAVRLVEQLLAHCVALEGHFLSELARMRVDLLAHRMRVLRDLAAQDGARLLDLIAEHLQVRSESPVQKLPTPLPIDQPEPRTESHAGD